MTTMKQPFQCNLQPEIQEPHTTTHTGTTTRCKTHRRNNSRTKRPQPQPPHRRGTFHRRLQPLYTEKHKVSCSGFLPNSPLPFLTTSHRHQFSSSPLPIVTTSLRHHPVIVTTLHQGQFHRFLFLCYVLLCYALLCDLPPFIKVNSTASLSFIKVKLCYVLLCDLPPFIKVNSTASYSCVMYCYVMYCYVIYHPSSRSIPPLLILLLCIVMLCIVTSRTTLHHSQFHQVKVIRNSEVLLPNFL